MTPWKTEYKAFGYVLTTWGGLFKETPPQVSDKYKPNYYQDQTPHNARKSAASILRVWRKAPNPHLKRTRVYL